MFSRTPSRSLSKKSKVTVFTSMLDFLRQSLIHCLTWFAYQIEFMSRRAHAAVLRLDFTGNSHCVLSTDPAAGSSPGHRFHTHRDLLCRHRRSWLQPTTIGHRETTAQSVSHRLHSRGESLLRPAEAEAAVSLIPTLRHRSVHHG